jgi:hypothetical protein
MNQNAKLLVGSLCTLAVLIIIGVAGSQSAIAAEETNIGADIISGGVIVYPPESVQTNTKSGESPELALNETWTALNLGEGNIEQVEITVTTVGFVDVIAHLGGDNTESKRISDHDVLTFQCYKIDFQNGFPYEYNNAKIVYYDYVITELNGTS